MTGTGGSVRHALPWLIPSGATLFRTGGLREAAGQRGGTGTSVSVGPVGNPEGLHVQRGPNAAAHVLAKSAAARSGLKMLGTHGRGVVKVLTTEVGLGVFPAVSATQETLRRGAGRTISGNSFDEDAVGPALDSRHPGPALRSEASLQHRCQHPVNTAVRHHTIPVTCMW